MIAAHIFTERAMPSAAATLKSTRTKTHSVAVNAGESVVIVRKGDRTTLAALGRKVMAAMRRRKCKAGVETASEGTRAIRDGR
jgi:hypothetical protein